MQSFLESTSKKILLMKQNIIREAHRLQIYNRHIATDKIWNFRSTVSQRHRFTALANHINNINQPRFTNSDDK